MIRRLSLILCLLALCSWKPDTRQWLYVLHASSGQLSAKKLEIKQVNGRVAAVSTDPDREARSVPLKALIKHWNQIFVASAPNAALNFVDKDGNPQEVIIILKKPKMTSGSVTFQIERLNQGPKGKLGELILYIDAGGAWCTVLPNGGQECGGQYTSGNPYG